MKAQNLNELRYILVLTHPGIEPDGETNYYVDSWPNPELAQEVLDDKSTFHAFDSVYFSTTITHAKTFDSFVDARNYSNSLHEFAQAWEGSVVAVSAKIFFKARLMG